MRQRWRYREVNCVWLLGRLSLQLSDPSGHGVLQSLHERVDVKRWLSWPLLCLLSLCCSCCCLRGFFFHFVVVQHFATNKNRLETSTSSTSSFGSFLAGFNHLLQLQRRRGSVWVSRAMMLLRFMRPGPQLQRSNWIIEAWTPTLITIYLDCFKVSADDHDVVFPAGIFKKHIVDPIL